jgi:signal transduction histidine kinase
VTHAPTRSDDTPKIDVIDEAWAADLSQLISSTVGWVRTAVGWATATVRVLLPDEAGRLRVAVEAGEQVPGGRLRSSRRRAAFETLQSSRVQLADPPGHSLAFIPMISEGSAIGLVEVVAPTRLLEARVEILQTVVGQAGAVFRTARNGRESLAALRASSAMIRLAAKLLRAKTVADSVRAVAQVCFEEVRAPIVGLLTDRSEGCEVLAVRGLPANRRAGLRTALEAVRCGESGRSYAARLDDFLGGREVETIEAGSAVILVLDPPVAYRRFLWTAGGLLGESLERLATVEWAQLRNDNLDLAIACTAHELKGPLVGARAALHHVLDTPPQTEDRALLKRTQRELGQLVDLVDPFLRWSAGSGSLRRRRTDLVRIVSDAVTSCSWERDDRVVIVDAPSHVDVRADANQLRVAIANVVRNALEHSPPAGAVTVVVELGDDVASISVEDQGPGVPAAESDLIFDPFARGNGGRFSSRAGSGLGLFIARRVVEAHGGSIDLRSIASGTTFRIELPLPDERRSRSAS